MLNVTSCSSSDASHKEAGAWLVLLSHTVGSLLFRDWGEHTSGTDCVRGIVTLQPSDSMGAASVWVATVCDCL